MGGATRRLITQEMFTGGQEDRRNVTAAGRMMGGTQSCMNRSIG